VATFPGKPPNPLGVKVELNLGGVWTDITLPYAMQRDKLVITNMGRADESSGIGPSQLTLTLKNTDGRFTPKNSAGAYFPGIVRNCQVRVSVNATSSTGVAYNQFRFFGEISSWPPASDVSGRDLYVQVVASGIWRRISQNSTPIGSPYTRYLNQLTGTSVPATAWAMEDGNGSTAFVTEVGAGAAATFTGTPSFSADATSFPGCDALWQANGARVTANVSSGATATNNVVRFALSVPAAGDSFDLPATFSAGAEVCKILSPSATGVKRWVVALSANQLVFQGYAAVSGGAALFSNTITTKVNGVPVLVSVELTPSGGSVNWACRIIKPGAGAALDQVTGTRATTTLAAVTQVFLDGQGRLADTTLGQLGVFYAVPSLVTAAAALGGFAGEFAVDRFNRLGTEFGIPTTVIGSTSAAMGPQPDDTLAAVLQQIEDTDGGLLYETRDQFGLGYRTLISMQNQAAAVTIGYAGGVLGDSTAPLTPTYDDQLLANTWTVTNTDGYVAQATLTSGAISVAAVPNGVGPYAKSANTNASTHAQVNAIAQQRLFLGTVDEVRYPTVLVNMARVQAAPFFATIPGLRLGDYLSITSVPATMGGTATSKQLIWGYSETIGAFSWAITFNTVPEAAWETAFSPGVFSVVQAPTQGVAQGSSVGSSVAASQIGAGAALPGTISARTIGGMTSFIAASTPYDWTFAVSGVPADVTYFTATEDQTLPITIGDTFVNTGGLGGPFTVTSLDAPSGGNVNVHFTPDASSVMSTGSVQGGKEGDTWVNTSGGNQVNIWHNGAWSPVTWTGSSVLAASSITSSLIAAGTVVAGIVDATTITGATLIATGTAGEILVYSGTPGAGNLIAAVSGQATVDAFSTPIAKGIEVKQGGLVMDSQGAAPSAVTGASVLYSSVAGRPRVLQASGADGVLDRSTSNVGTNTIGNTAVQSILSASMATFANEASVSTTYEIEIRGQFVLGSTTKNQLTLALLVDGAGFGGTGGGFTLGAAIGNLSSRWDYWATFMVSIITTGAGGTARASSAGNFALHASNLQVGATGTVAAAGLDQAAVAFDTTSAHTLQVYGQWGGTDPGATQTITNYQTVLRRID
jgi:hypothetical protein